jgi:hypothetical protein
VNLLPIGSRAWVIMLPLEKLTQATFELDRDRNFKNLQQL